MGRDPPTTSSSPGITDPRGPPSTRCWSSAGPTSGRRITSVDPRGSRASTPAPKPDEGLNPSRTSGSGRRSRCESSEQGVDVQLDGGTPWVHRESDRVGWPRRRGVRAEEEHLERDRVLPLPAAEPRDVQDRALAGHPERWSERGGPGSIGRRTISALPLDARGPDDGGARPGEPGVRERSSGPRGVGAASRPAR